MAVLAREDTVSGGGVAVWVGRLLRWLGSWCCILFEKCECGLFLNGVLKQYDTGNS